MEVSSTGGVWFGNECSKRALMATDRAAEGVDACGGRWLREAQGAVRLYVGPSWTLDKCTLHGARKRGLGVRLRIESGERSGLQE